MASTSASAEFHETFRTAKAEILSLIRDQPTQISEIAGRLSALRSLFASQIGGLPSYDQRQYDMALNELEAQLKALRSKEKPKSKFAFNRKPASSAPGSALEPLLSAGRSAEMVSEDARYTAEPTGQSASSYTLSDLHKRRITPALIEGLDGEYSLSLTDISDSVIDLRNTDTVQRLKSLHARDVRRCVLITDQLEASALLHDFQDSLLILAAHQFRMHTSTRCKVLLHVTSVPVIEHCSELVFARYPEEMSLELNGENKVDQVADFDWIRAGPSPNWRLLSVEDNSLSRAQIDALGKAETGDALKCLLAA